MPRWDASPRRSMRGGQRSTGNNAGLHAPRQAGAARRTAAWRIRTLGVIGETIAKDGCLIGAESTSGCCHPIAVRGRHPLLTSGKLPEKPALPNVGGKQGSLPMKFESSLVNQYIKPHACALGQQLPTCFSIMPNTYYLVPSLLRDTAGGGSPLSPSPLSPPLLLLLLTTRMSTNGNPTTSPQHNRPHVRALWPGVHRRW